jgi:hypothetical protein
VYFILSWWDALLPELIMVSPLHLWVLRYIGISKEGREALTGSGRVKLHVWGNEVVKGDPLIPHCPTVEWLVWIGRSWYLEQYSGIVLSPGLSWVLPWPVLTTVPRRKVDSNKQLQNINQTIPATHDGIQILEDRICPAGLSGRENR